MIKLIFTYVFYRDVQYILDRIHLNKFHWLCCISRNYCNVHILPHTLAHMFRFHKLSKDEKSRQHLILCNSVMMLTLCITLNEINDLSKCLKNTHLIIMFTLYLHTFVAHVPFKTRITSFNTGSIDMVTRFLVKALTTCTVAWLSVWTSIADFVKHVFFSIN